MPQLQTVNTRFMPNGIMLMLEDVMGWILCHQWILVAFAVKQQRQHTFRFFLFYNQQVAVNVIWLVIQILNRWNLFLFLFSASSSCLIMLISFWYPSHHTDILSLCFRFNSEKEIQTLFMFFYYCWFVYLKQQIQNKSLWSFMH